MRNKLVVTLALLFLVMLGPVTFAQGAGHTVTLNWTPGSAADAPNASYNVYRGTVSGAESTTPLNGATPVAAGCTTATTCTFVDSTVAGGQKYFYVVKAVVGGVSSAASNEASATVGVAAPVLNTPTVQ